MKFVVYLVSFFLLLAPARSAGVSPVRGFTENPWPGEATFRAYGPDDGLNSSGISSLTQDKAGFLWVATDLGLFWFDGNRFHNLGAKEGFQVAPGTRIWADPAGGIWASTPGSVYRIENFKVRKASGIGGLPQLLTCFAMAWDEHLQPWLAMADAGLFQQSQDGTFSRVPVDLAPFLVASAPRHGGMFIMDIGGHGAIWAHGRTSAQWKLTEPGATEVVSGLEDGNGRIWVLTRRGLWFKSPQDSEFRPFVHPALVAGGDSRDLQPDSKGGLWVATVRGLLHIHGDEWRLVSKVQGMPTESAAQVLVDREGSLWYASYGLFRQLGLGAWLAQTTREGLPTEIVWSLCRDGKGRLWAGTNLGLAVQEHGRWQPVPGSERTAVFSMLKLDNGGVLAAGRPRALLYVPPGSNKAQALANPLDPDPSNNQVFRLVRDARGDPWVFGGSGICRLTLHGSNLQPAEKPQPPDPSFLLNTFCSISTADGALWFAARDGLSRYHQGRWRQWTVKDGLLANGLYGLASTPDGSILISYYNSLGVSRLRVEGDALKVLHTYRMEQGELPTNAVFSIHLDRAGRTWLLTDVGPVLLEDRGYRAFGVGFGLLGQDMVQNCFQADGDGTLWFGNAGGLARFDSAKFPWDLPMPAPVLVDLQFGGQEVPFGDRSTLRVSARDNSMDASLGFLSFARAKSFHYEVRIDGYDTRWRKEALSRLRYLAFPTGTYSLRVRAVADGRPGAETEVGFRILPPWYKTAWAWGLYMLGAAGVSWAILLLRTHQLQREKVRLEGLVDDRTTALKRSNQELVDYISEIKTLRGLIPICSVCKKIRSAPGDWEQMEAYISEHTEAKFSHGYCPDCYEQVRTEFIESRKK
jgi:ligand-binding sensor domain-containing protein